MRLIKMISAKKRHNTDDHIGIILFVIWILICRNLLVLLKEKEQLVCYMFLPIDRIRTTKSICLTKDKEFENWLIFLVSFPTSSFNERIKDNWFSDTSRRRSKINRNSFQWIWLIIIQWRIHTEWWACVHIHLIMISYVDIIRTILKEPNDQW
jgi:hypothetical protein